VRDNYIMHEEGCWQLEEVVLQRCNILCSLECPALRTCFCASTNLVQLQSVLVYYRLCDHHMA